jgi:alpha-beta hydrolase superfamily lysophospholipase
MERVRARGGGARRGVVVCLHAMMTDGRYFGARTPSTGSFAGALADAGLDVVVADLRGHGRSVPPDARRDDWSFDDYVELDLPAIVTAAARASDCSIADVSLLGHSLGGLVAAAAIATGRIPRPRALVLVASGVWLGGGSASLRRRAAMAVYRTVAARLGYAPIRALRAGTADEPRSYVEQLAGWARTGRWTSRRGADYLAALNTIDTPTASLVSARGDWMCTPRDAGELAGRIATAAPMRVVGRAHGDALDPDHFGLITRGELAPLRRWIADALVR